MKKRSKITKKQDACIDGYKWVLRRKSDGAKETLEALLKHNPEWANWTVARLLNRKQKIQYAVFAAEQVLDLFEKKHPNDNRPRLAINAAKAVIKSNTKKNRAAAEAAGAAAGDAMKEKIIRYGMSLIGIGGKK